MSGEDPSIRGVQAMTSSKNIVPFGKHKGRPVEVLLADRKYSEWLAAQEWFRERFVDLFKIISAGGGASQDTPEHNAMQVKFLNRDHFVPWVIRNRGQRHLAECAREVKRCLDQLDNAFLREVRGNWVRAPFPRLPNGSVDLSRSLCTYVTAPNADPAVIARYNGGRPSSIEDLHAGDRATLLGPAGISEFQVEYSKSFEARGADVGAEVEFRWGTDGQEAPLYQGKERFRIELKPAMGDDFPAVLRQAQASQCDLVMVGQYTGSGATWEQVQEVFKTSHITLIFESDLTAE